MLNSQHVELISGTNFLFPKERFGSSVQTGEICERRQKHEPLFSVNNASCGNELFLDFRTLFSKGAMKFAVSLTVQYWFRPNQIRRACVSRPNSHVSVLVCYEKFFISYRLYLLTFHGICCPYNSVNIIFIPL